MKFRIKKGTNYILGAGGDYSSVNDREEVITIVTDIIPYDLETHYKYENGQIVVRPLPLSRLDYYRNAQPRRWYEIRLYDINILLLKKSVAQELGDNGLIPWINDQLKIISADIKAFVDAGGLL